MNKQDAAKLAALIKHDAERTREPKIRTELLCDDKSRWTVQVYQGNKGHEATSLEAYKRHHWRTYTDSGTSYMTAYDVSASAY